MEFAELNAQTRIAARLYIRDVCKEFTRPTAIAHPEIASEYNASISHPTDLGTILLRCMKHEMELEELKSELRTMILNALEFNQDQVMMENIAFHIYAFAIGLYEEISGKTWKDSDGKEKILERRRNRCFILQKEYLHRSEIEEFCKVLEMCIQESVDLPDQDSRKVAILKCRSLCEDALSRSRSIQLSSLFEPLADIVISDSQNGSIADKESLPAITTLLFLHKFDSGNLEDSTISLSSCIASRRRRLTVGGTPDAIATDTTPLSLVLASAAKHVTTDGRTLEMLSRIDTMIGEVLVCMEERLMRGSELSFYWATPLEAVWAQPDSKETVLSKLPWWPCTVIGGGNGTSVPKSLTAANISRLPADVVKQLKQRCKVFAKGMGVAEKKAIEHRVYKDNQSAHMDSLMRLDGLQIPDDYVDGEKSIPLNEADKCDYVPTPLKMPSTAELVLDYELRPGTCHSSTVSLTIPPKCLLVEYFDVHDVGLVHADYVIYMNSSAQFPCKASVATKKMGAGEQACTQAFEAFKSTVSSLMAPLDHDVTQLPSIEQLEHAVSVSEEGSSLKFEQRNNDPGVRSAVDSPARVSDIISAAIATVEAGDTNEASDTNISALRRKSPRSFAGHEPIDISQLTFAQTRKRVLAEGEGVSVFPPHMEAFAWGHFDPNLIPIKGNFPLRDSPSASESGVGRTRGGETNKTDSNKKQRALARTRAVLEWLEATAPLQSSAMYLQGGEKEEPYETPLSSQMKHLREAAGIIEEPEPIETKEKTANETADPGTEAPVVSTAKKYQFRSAEHITKDFSRVVSSLPSEEAVCRYVCGEGVVHTRSLATESMLLRLESSFIDERITILRSQIKDLDQKIEAVARE